MADVPRHVLIVSSFVAPRVGGVERYTEWLARSLRGAGSGVRIIACDVSGNDSADTRVPCRLLGGAGWPLVLPSPRTLRTIAREVRRADAVLIQNHAHPLCLYAALAAARYRRARATFVHTAQPSTGGSAAYRAFAWAYDRSLTLALFAAARPVAFSGSVTRYVKARFGFRAARIRFPLGELPPRTTSTTPGTLRVVWVGRMSAEKDPELAVRAVQHARERHDVDVELVMVGAGPLLEELQGLVPERPWLDVRGPVTPADALSLQAGADVVLNSSRQESLGIVLLESVVMGVPVVGSDLGDAMEHLGPELGPRYLVRPPVGDGVRWAGAAAEVLARIARTRDAVDAEFAARAPEVHSGYSERAALDSVLELLGAPHTRTGAAP